MLSKMNPKADKLRSFIFTALLYAAAACFLLSKIAPAGLYKSWDTTRYLVVYCLLSLIYLIWISKLLKRDLASTIPAGIVAVMVFSLIFSLIKLEGNLMDLALTRKVQRVYFLLFSLVLMYAVLYNVTKSVYSAALTFKNRNSTFPTLSYFTFHYVALIPYFVYALVKDKNVKHIIIAIAVLGACGIGTLVNRNKVLKDNIYRLLRFIWDEKRFIFLIFAFALAVRVLFAVQLTRNLPPGMMGGPDSLSISEQARYVAETGDISAGPGSFISQKGSVILFYALIYKIFGYSPLAARLFNALLGAFSVLFTYYIARFIFNPTAAKIAAFLTAGYGYMIQYGIYIGSESLGLFTLELFILGIIVASQKRSPRRFNIWPLISGIALALAVMARPEYYYALTVVFLWIFYIFRNKKADILFFFAGFFIIAAPWMYRNLVVLGEPVMSSLLGSKIKDGYMGGALWHYEITKFAEAGLPVSTIKEIIWSVFYHPYVSLSIVLPHILKGIYNFWDYNTFFSPAFVFIEPKSSGYNMILCFYLYSFMIAGFFVSRRKFDFAALLLFLIILKTITYIFTASPTFWDGANYVPELKDWYRFTMVPLTHIFMGGGIAYLISKIEWKNEKYSP